MDLKFPTDYKIILKKLGQIDPVIYGKTRNYVNGGVTYLSPYISRDVISTRQVLQSVFERGYKLSQPKSSIPKQNFLKLQQYSLMPGHPPLYITTITSILCGIKMNRATGFYFSIQNFFSIIQWARNCIEFILAYIKKVFLPKKYV